MLRHVSVAVALAWLAIAFIYIAFSKSIVEASYQGRSVGILNHLVANHRSLMPETRDLAFYQHKRTTLFIELSLLVGLCESYLILEIRRTRLLHAVKERVRRFFTSPDHPVNLAVFRIVFFGFWACSFDLDRIVGFSQLPAELRLPPVGFGWFLSHVSSFDPAVITILGWCLRISCITAMIGLLTGPSALIVAILGFVLCGIPMSYGKVGGHNFMIWFAALLAVSRCADMLSVDAVIRAVRGGIPRPAPSRDYALPLRLIWTLMGIHYFFGGMWKAIDGRWNWIFSENLRYHIYTRWHALHKLPYLAQFAINQHRWFFYAAALITVAFELSFIALMVVPRVRPFLIAGGLLFHNSLGLLMRNPFVDLQMCYVSFVDWHAIFRWLGKQLFRQPLYVLYDDECKLCRRTVSCLQVFDALERVSYVDASPEKTVSQNEPNQFGQIRTLHDRHIVISDRTKRGDLTYLSIVKRVPLLWFVYPLVLLWPIRMSAKRIHSTAIYSRRCNTARPRMISTAGNPFNSCEEAGVPRILIFVGVTLIATNTAFGLLHVRGWPFTCGPTFARILTPEIRTLALQRIDRSGNVAVYERLDAFHSVCSWLSGEWLEAIYNNIYSHPEKPELAIAFSEFLIKSVPGWSDAASIRFYAERVSILPTEQSKNPSDKQLFFEYER